MAALVIPADSPACGFERGDQQGRSVEYHRGPVGIVVGTVLTRIRGTFIMDGLVVHAEARPDIVANRDVRLLMGDVPVQATRTDDLGGFTFEAVAAGTYRLEIALSDTVVVVEHLPVGSRS